MHLLVHGAFEAQVARTPDAVSLTGDDGRLTYLELDRRANAIARRLLEHGVRRGEIVITAFDRCIEAVAAILGVLKAGAVYCPLDLQDPPARHQWTLQDTRPAAVLTSRSLRRMLPANLSRILFSEDVVRSADPAVAGDPIQRNDPCCVMYTSGSTGEAKATLVPHRGITRLLLESDYVHFSSRLRSMLHSPMHFDATTFEIWAPLLHGGCCVICSGGSTPSLRDLGENIRARCVNTLFLGPSLFNLAVDQCSELFCGLDTVLLGGDVVSAKHVRQAQMLFPRMRFINAYGPTETTTFATTYTVPERMSAATRSLPIGKPIARTSCYLLDENLRPVVDPAIGELYIGGDGVTLGYINRPELTAARFIADPFATDKPNALMYRTGDLCRRLPDGNLDFVGRADAQVKIREKRIELGEIEVTLGAHPDVAQCIVTVCEIRGEKQLVGYFTLKTGAVRSADEITRYLREILPVHLVPQWLIALKELPYKSNGKFDRAALPQPVFTPAVHSSQEPQTAREMQLLKHWRQVLHEDRIGVDDCFLQMGGSSLDALRLCYLIEKELDRVISVSDIMQHSTARQLARQLDGSDRGQHEGLIPLNDESAIHRLFCIHGHIGNPWSLRPLAAHWDGLISAYTIAFPGLDGKTQPHDKVEDAAAYFLSFIRARQPRGPYHLLGYSYGGIVAFDIARQLANCGEEVASLILLDSFLSEASRFDTIGERIRFHSSQIVTHGPGHLARRLRFRFTRSATSADTAAAQGTAARLIADVQALNLEAYRRYRATPVPVGALLVRCAHRPDSFKQLRKKEVRGWARVLKRLENRDVPGDHLSMLQEPHATSVAQHVSNYLLGNSRPPGHSSASVSDVRPLPHHPRALSR